VCGVHVGLSILHVFSSTAQSDNRAVLLLLHMFLLVNECVCTWRACEAICLRFALDLCSG
jgi:hypothetical protein